MRRETDEAIAASQQRNEELADKLARLAGHNPDAVLMPEPSLPIADVTLVTMTLDELHDLIYAATTTYLRTLTGMTRQRSHQHAARISAEALLITDGQDYKHRGTDPRG